jgi:hypothetical protein
LIGFKQLTAMVLGEFPVAFKVFFALLIRSRRKKRTVLWIQGIPPNFYD